MWYTGYSSSADIAQIGYATSTDGINWTKDSNNPVLSVGASGSWDSDLVANPAVIKDGSVYKMWYEASDAGKWLRIGYATSSVSLQDKFKNTEISLYLQEDN